MGCQSNLVAAHPQNLNAARLGIYSSRVLAPRAREVADQLMSLPHVRPLDALAADEIGSIVARLESIDLDLDERGQLGRSGAKSLLEHRVRLKACGDQLVRRVHKLSLKVHGQRSLRARLVAHIASKRVCIALPARVRARR
jgi:hypothetical protein